MWWRERSARLIVEFAILGDDLLNDVRPPAHSTVAFPALLRPAMHIQAFDNNLFRTLLASSFDALPDAVRVVHLDSNDIRLRGLCKVKRGTTWISKAMGFFAQLPPAGDEMPVDVRIERRQGRERWARRFGSHRMTSVLSTANGCLIEAMGPLRFVFALQGSEQGIRWVSQRISLLGLTLPLSWFRFDVQERSEHGRYVFDVRVALVGAGLLVHYLGWLEIAEPTD